MVFLPSASFISGLLSTCHESKNRLLHFFLANQFWVSGLTRVVFHLIEIFCFPKLKLRLWSDLAVCPKQSFLFLSVLRHQFVENNLILKMGPVDKRKVRYFPINYHLFSRMNSIAVQESVKYSFITVSASERPL